MIKQEGKRWFVRSEDGKKNLGKKEGYASKQEAINRLKQIEYFKNH